MSGRSANRPDEPPNNESKAHKMHTTEITLRLTLTDSTEVAAESFMAELLADASEHLLDGESIDLVSVHVVPAASHRLAA